MYIISAENVTILNSTFSNNYALGPIGGNECYGSLLVYNSTNILVSGCTFINNTATSQSWVSGDVVETFGAGLAITSATTYTNNVTIINTIFEYNTVGSQGAGLFISGGPTVHQPTVSIENCIFQYNTLYRPT